MKIIALISFFKDVAVESKKISWIDMREVVMTTAIVSVVVLIVGLFFLLSDFIIYKLLYLLMNIGV